MILDIGRAGTVAVGEFAKDGRLIAYKANGPFPADLAGMASQFSATVRMFLGTVAASFSHLTDLPLVPYQGFMYSGGDMSSVIRQDSWAILKTAESDLRRPADAAQRGLEELLELSGVRFAGFYGVDGGEIAAKETIGFDRETRETATQLIASTTAALRGLATAFSHLSKTSWVPLTSWLYAGGDWVIVANPCCWILAEAGSSETDELYRAIMR